MNKTIAVLVSLACILLLPALAFAADGIGTSPSEPLGMLFGALAVMGATLVARAVGPEKFKGDAVGGLLAFAAALAGAFVEMARGAQPWNMTTIGAALMIAITAMGGWSGVWKRMLLPLLAKKWPSLAAKE